MNEIEFAIWLKDNNCSKKAGGDYISRLKRLERSLKDCDLDEEYNFDRCASLISLFTNKGENPSMESRLIGSLPIGKYQLATFPYAIRRYVQFRDEIKGEK